MKRDFRRFADITAEECLNLLERAAFMKEMRRLHTEHKPLRDRTLAMIFEKASTRTRVSFEIGIQELGGAALFLSPSDTQIGRGEPIKDTARVLSRYVHAIMIRTFAHETVDELALWATVPVINGLSDRFHPCQILADLQTIKEFKGGLEGLTIAYIGDGNNVANSWVEAASLLGLSLVVAAPSGYLPEEGLLDEGRARGRVSVTHDPLGAAEGADVLYTDVWVSMGMEKEKAERQKAFASFCIDDRLVAAAKPGAIVMHCLPAYRNQEISDDVFERFESVIFTQAENRLHAQKALLEWLMTEG